MVYLWVYTVPQIYIIIICKKFKHANIFCSLGGTPSFLELHPLSLQTAVHPAPCASQRAIWRGHHSPRRVGPARNLYPCRCLNVGGKHGTWVSFPLVLGHPHGENDDFTMGFWYIRMFRPTSGAWPWVPWCPWCRWHPDLRNGRASPNAPHPTSQRTCACGPDYDLRWASPHDLPGWSLTSPWNNA